MGGISDIITKLYKRFFLRDLLSYVCPGLIVLVSFVLLIPNPWFKPFYEKISIGFGEGILIFLFSFVIGLGINALIELIIHDVTDVPYSEGDLIK